MPELRASLEIIAPTVEEAVTRGAAELGVDPDRVVVEILDEGGKGMFGLGSRQARVRLTVLSAARPPAAEAGASDEDGEEPLQVTQEILHELLERMGVDAQVTAAWGQADSPDDPTPLLVDIRGQDLSLLIGRRGETLAALQYITRLIVGKELHRPTAIMIDVDGYRARRERQLRQLARRMADEAIERDRTMTLEPMPANERRIIHIELRDHAGVRTESVGEGDQRKVTVIPVH
ncbi:MAG: protein jag [Actinobacteria bacterium]|nr:protein jag [Actinomycetota bacterium]